MGSNLGNVPADAKFTRHLDGLYPTLESLVEASDAVSETVASPGWTILLELLDAEIATIDRELDTDRPLESRSHYAAKHGRRGGLRGAIEAAHALRVRAESRLEEQRRKHEGAAEPVPIGG